MFTPEELNTKIIQIYKKGYDPSVILLGRRERKEFNCCYIDQDSYKKKYGDANTKDCYIYGYRVIPVELDSFFEVY